MANIKRNSLLIAIAFFLFANSASADYSAFEKNITIPPPNLSLTYLMTGFSSNQYAGFRYTATSTVTQFDRVTIPFCRLGGSVGGIVDLEIKFGTTSNPILASSTIAINNGNITPCGTVSGGFPINATTTTWVLNNSLQWVSGVEVYFIFHITGNTGGSFYFSQEQHGATTVGAETLFYFSGAPYLTAGNYYNIYGKGYALGSVPTNQNTYNASSTAAVCSTFDVGCYFSAALSWAFVPSSTVFDQFSTLKDDIKNKPPFGYFTSTYDAISGFNASSTPQFTLATSSAITTNIFSPVRTGLNWLIIFAGLYWLYRRLTEIHI